MGTAEKGMLSLVQRTHVDTTICMMGMLLALEVTLIPPLDSQGSKGNLQKGSNLTDLDSR